MGTNRRDFMKFMGIAAVAPTAMFARPTKGYRIHGEYPQGYTRNLQISGFPGKKSPLGKMIEVDGSSYTIIEYQNKHGEHWVLLDRPLEKYIPKQSQIEFSEFAGFTPTFHPDAIHVISRPMKGGTMISVDLLCGVAVLDQSMEVMELA